MAGHILTSRRTVRLCRLNVLTYHLSFIVFFSSCKLGDVACALQQRVTDKVTLQRELSYRRSVLQLTLPRTSKHVQGEPVTGPPRASSDTYDAIVVLCTRLSTTCMF